MQIIDFDLKRKMYETTSFENQTEQDIYIIAGNKKNFQSYMLNANKKTPIKLKSKKFGLVTNIEGQEVGKRKFQADVYTFNDGKDVKLKENEGDIEVIVNSKKQNPDLTEIFDEDRPSKLSRINEYSKVLGSLGKFMERL